MQKWKERGYVPDSDEEDELWSSESQRSFQQIAVPHELQLELKNGTLETPGGHKDGSLELPKISEEKTECKVQNTIVHHSYCRDKIWTDKLDRPRAHLTMSPP